MCWATGPLQLTELVWLPSTTRNDRSPCHTLTLLPACAGDHRTCCRSAYTHQASQRALQCHSSCSLSPGGRGRKLRGRKNPSLHFALDGVAGDVRDMPVADEPMPKRTLMVTAGCIPPVPLSWNTDAWSLMLKIQEGYETDPLYRSTADSERGQFKLSMASEVLYERSSAVAVPTD